MKRVLLGPASLRASARRYGLTSQGLSYHFRHALSHFVAHAPASSSPTGDLILLIDGLWFRFRQRPWVLYLMAVTPCGENYAVFLDLVLFPG